MTNAVSINGPTEYRPPKGSTNGYTDDKIARDDYGDRLFETDAEAWLLPWEIRDLRMFFCEGVASTFGRQLDAALSQRISDDAMHDARMMKALRTRLRKGWQPNKTRQAKRAKKSKASRRSPITEVFLEHVGISVGMVERVAPEVADVGGLMTERDAYLRGLDGADLSDQTIYMHPAHTTFYVPPEKRGPSDEEIQLARTTWKVACRLNCIEERHRKTLGLAYGLPSGEWSAPMCEEDYVAKHGDADGFRFNSPRATALKKFGHLLEVVVGIVREERDASGPLATKIILAHINEDAWVRAKRHAANGRTKAAAKAYAETR